ncbi:sugar ABC transporter substrate-binding protein [soil metagenome]
MGDREKLAEQLLMRQLSRRTVLKAGAAMPLGAAMTSLLTGRTLAQEPAPDFSGVNLRLWSGATTGPPAERAAAEWAELTGGSVQVEVIPFAERSIKFAGLIAGQDSSIDVLYIYSDFAGRFGDRLYENLSDPQWGIDTSPFVPAIIPVLSAAGGLRGLPLHSEMLIYIYNKPMLEAAGLDPENPPDTWEGLYAAAEGLTEGDRFPCQLAWQADYGGAGFYLPFLNSLPDGQLLSEDRTQVLFDGEDGLLAFQTIEAGMRGGFFDPNLAPDQTDYAIGQNFNDGKTASQIAFAELWGYAVGGAPEDFPTTLLPDDVGATILPGILSGTSGSINGFEGFGLNKFGTQKAPALHFLQYLSGFDYQKSMNLAKTLPSSRVDVLGDPEVQAEYPIGPVLAEQGQWNLSRYPSPFDWTPPVSDALGRLYRGEITAEEAHEQAVAGVNDIVITYLSS